MIRWIPKLPQGEQLNKNLRVAYQIMFLAIPWKSAVGLIYTWVIWKSVGKSKIHNKDEDVLTSQADFIWRLSLAFSKSSDCSLLTRIDGRHCREQVENSKGWIHTEEVKTCFTVTLKVNFQLCITSFCFYPVSFLDRNSQWVYLQAEKG